MEKKKEKEFTEESETDFADAVCATECTGLMQGMPVDEADKENYGEVYDYGPEADETTRIRADKVTESKTRFPN